MSRKLSDRKPRGEVKERQIQKRNALADARHADKLLNNGLGRREVRRLMSGKRTPLNPMESAYRSEAQETNNA